MQNNKEPELITPRSATRFEILHKATSFITLIITMAVLQYIITIDSTAFIFILGFGLITVIVNLLFPKLYKVCKCGTIISYRDKYCKNCGNRLIID